MHLPDPPNVAHPGVPRRLPIARLLLPLAAANTHGDDDLVELDRRLLEGAAAISQSLAHAGWTLALNVDGAHVDLVALKRTATVEAAVAELSQLAVSSGSLYFDSADQTTTTHNVELSNPTRIVEVDEAPPDDTRPPDHELETRLGALVASHVPAGTDSERLLRALEHSTLGEVVGDVALNLGGDHDDEDADEDRRTPLASGEDVTIELPDHEPTQMPAVEAAQRMVEAYGARARNHVAAGRRVALDTYWAEVERLLTRREDEARRQDA